MTCRSIEPQLDDYLDGTLDSDTAFVLEQHVAACSHCKQLLEHATDIRDALSRLGIEGPRPGFFDAALVLAAASAEAEPSSHRSRWYVGALAAGVAAVALVGFLVSRVETESMAGVAQVAMAIEETRTINMVFAAEEALENVHLSVTLPDGIELASYPGRDRIEWSTRLRQGNNVLPLELIALGGTGGELIATMRRDGKEKVFRVSIAVMMG
jgi:hypothetical protein